MLRSWIRFLLIVPVGLSLPLIATQFSADVQWSTADFATAAILLVGVSIAFTVMTATPPLPRWLRNSAVGVVGISILVWLELAIGVFGTPWAGA